MLKVGVKDFGPIREGRVTLRPLTIFVGPNNVGKSYFASLIYALSDPSSGLGVERWVKFFSAPASLPVTESVKEWLGDQSNLKQSIQMNELPNGIREYVEKAVSELINEFVNLFGQQIQRCFGSALAELVRKGSRNSFRLSLGQDEPPLQIELLAKNGKFKVVSSQWDLSEMRFDFAQFTPLLDLAKVTGSLPRMANILLNLVMVPVFSRLFRNTYYFPAARSGVLQSHTVLASAVISRWPLVGIESFEIPKLSGTVADFIGHLLGLQKQRRPVEVSKVAAFLESKISKGRIDIETPQTGFEYPEIFYKSNSVKYPLYRTSSMVSEVAPIVLFLKYLINQGDLLIIEEPEAHLHPDNQRIFAWAIVKLIRLGVHVLITTHSDYFVQQISNFILLSKVAAEDRVKLRHSENLRYSDDDYLRADEVGAYRFDFDKRGSGSRVKELEVTAEDGIPQSQFVATAENIYDETIRLDRLGAEN